MAAITSTAVVFLQSWEGISKGNKTVRSHRRCRVTLAAQGGTTGDMPAALFNLAEVYEVYAFGLNNVGTWTWVPVILDQTTDSNGVVKNTGILTCSPSTGALASATGVLEILITGRTL